MRKMTHEFSLLWQQARKRASKRLNLLRRDESGATAIEFALVATPFLMLLFGIIAVGLYFFTTFSLENAVEAASRPIRTGEWQTMTPAPTRDSFKQQVCSLVPAYVDCDGKLRINVQSYNVGDAIVAPACVDAGGALVPSASTPYAVGAANQIMLVTACLQWKLAGEIPFLQLGSMADGSALIQASTTFKVEPFQ
jgi:Flp pilus assembly protein TadG